MTYWRGGPKVRWLLVAFPESPCLIFNASSGLGQICTRHTYYVKESYYTGTQSLKGMYGPRYVQFFGQIKVKVFFEPPHFSFLGFNMVGPTQFSNLYNIPVLHTILRTIMPLLVQLHSTITGIYYCGNFGVKI